MGKLNQLLGVASNLADSFVSVTNIEFLHYIESQPIKNTELFKINLLNESIKPEELNSKKIKNTFEKYKKWFNSEIKKLKIELNEIESVSIKVSYKPGKTFARYYTCNVTIKAKGKSYTKKVMSSFN